jgi:hypothetical protein
MLYREIIAVCSQSHKTHKYSVCGQNAELLVVHVLTTERESVNLATVGSGAP